ncbi:amidohydrolase family protein [Ravibacter arvi]|uniref:Amidohydrolase family protein n=1 Tax=Ravibacter arvi TaxID=2051041 RepID=A0ABP8MAC8_9BACT
MKVDSHQHFWKYHPVKDAWINDEMAVIKNDFMPEDLEPLLEQSGIDGCVAVQADQSEAETHFLLDLLEKHDFIKAVVGWIDLRAKNLDERLEYFSQFKALKGFRHIVQAEPEVDFLLRDDFCSGIAKLADYGYTYDVLIYPKHIRNAVSFVKRFPDQPFVVDHIAKPFIKAQVIDEWAKDMQGFKGLDHVTCKISGLITEADWVNWKYDDFKKYIDVTLDIFGTDRVMFGTDWPVCLVGASYAEVCEILRRNTLQLSAEENKKLWGQNCIDFYKI